MLQTKYGDLTSNTVISGRNKNVKNVLQNFNIKHFEKKFVFKDV